MDIVDRKIEQLFYSTIEVLKQITELRRLNEYDFSVLNELIFKCADIDNISDELKKAVEINILSEYGKNKDAISKKILEYARSNYDIYILYDAKSYNTQSIFQQRLTTYRKIFEILLLGFININKDISQQYISHIHNIINHVKFLDYQTLGFTKTPMYRAQEVKTKKFITFPAKSLDKEVKKNKLKIEKFSTKRKKLTEKEINNIRKNYEDWWKSYKNYIDENFPVLIDDIDYYKGVNIKVIVTEIQTPAGYTDTGVAVCEAFANNKENSLSIEIDSEINKILFFDDEYNEYENLIVNWSFDLSHEAEIKDRVSSFIISDVNVQIMKLYKASIDYDEFRKLSQIVFSFSGYECGEKQINRIFINNGCSFIIEDCNKLVVLNKDLITGNKKQYQIYITNDFNRKWFNSLNAKEDSIILTSSVVSTKQKEDSKHKKIFIKDIDDIFSMLKTKIMLNKSLSSYIHNDVIYPYLESKNGSFKLNKNVVQADKLIERLNNCPQGTAGWRDFEKLSFDILNFLFNDSFESLRIKEQARNDSGTCIRDFIILNNGKHSFWKDIKQFYDCRNIIIEVKNTENKIKNDEFRQVSDYLSKETIGKFGMIFSRNGLSDNGKIKQKEHLTNRDKELIIVLDDNDITDLIRKKANNEDPEKLLEDIKFDLETS